MFVPIPPRKPAEIPPGAARILLAAAVPLLAAALTLALFRDRAAVAGPASWLVIVMLGLLVAWLAIAAFGGRASG
jgi:hypothetical protein